MLSRKEETIPRVTSFMHLLDSHDDICVAPKLYSIPYICWVLFELVISNTWRRERGWYILPTFVFLGSGSISREHRTGRNRKPDSIPLLELTIVRLKPRKLRSYANRSNASFLSFGRFYTKLRLPQSFHRDYFSRSSSHLLWTSCILWKL